LGINILVKRCSGIGWSSRIISN